MSAEQDATSTYRCFEKTLRAIEIFGFFSEVTATWPRRVIFHLTWSIMYWFLLSSMFNIIILLKLILTNPDIVMEVTAIIQRVLEVFLLPLFICEMRSFMFSYYAQVQEMRRSFDTHPALMAQCKKQETILLILSTALLASAIFCGYFLKVVFGLPSEELVLVKYYYHKARPERQLPFIMWFPFDDTVDPFYYLALAMNVFLMLSAILFSIHINTCSLIFAIHLRGQFLILSSYLRQVGNPHLFVYRNTGGAGRGGKAVQGLDGTTSGHHGPAVQPKVRSVLKSTFEDNLDPEEYHANLRQAISEGRSFEHDCFIFIVRRHQYLLDFRNRLEARFKVMVVFKMLAYIPLTVSLYQMSFASQLDMVAIQFLLQLIATLCFPFVVTHASEIIEEGNEALRMAAWENDWTRELRFAPARRGTARVRERKNATAQARLLFLLMCERPLKFMYFGGALKLCNKSFLTVLRFCYSVFALLKNSIQVK